MSCIDSTTWYWYTSIILRIDRIYWNSRANCFLIAADVFVLTWWGLTVAGHWLARLGPGDWGHWEFTGRRHGTQHAVKEWLECTCTLLPSLPLGTCCSNFVQTLYLCKQKLRSTIFFSLNCLCVCGGMNMYMRCKTHRMSQQEWSSMHQPAMHIDSLAAWPACYRCTQTISHNKQKHNENSI